MEAWHRAPRSRDPPREHREACRHRNDPALSTARFAGVAALLHLRAVVLGIRSSGVRTAWFRARNMARGAPTGALWSVGPWWRRSRAGLNARAPAAAARKESNGQADPARCVAHRVDCRWGSDLDSVYP